MPSVFFPEGYKALVIGSSGAIGSAFVAAFRADPACQAVESISRLNAPGFDLENAASIEAAAQTYAPKGPFNIIIDATGALTINGRGPEKRLSAIDAGHLTKSFALNTVGPALLLRHFAEHLVSGPAIYAKLSARVGSIADNQKGGWYSYRASKAAINMILQTAALELQRKNPALIVAALQPGTVASKLSQPFAAGTVGLLQPEDSVQGMLRALEDLQLKLGAHFIDYQGNEIPW
jgi:NAD(P)-dependent dehydrogenase (short-subunit alcohol dehydrogenase family)